MTRTAKRYKKNTEKKISGIPVCMAAIYARLSVDNDEKKSESIETQVTLIKEFIQKHNENPDREYEIAVYDIYSDLGKTGTNFTRIQFILPALTSFIIRSNPGLSKFVPVFPKSE